MDARAGTLPRWLQDVVLETDADKRRVSGHEAWRRMREGTITPREHRNLLVGFWPLIERFPQLRPDAARVRAIRSAITKIYQPYAFALDARCTTRRPAPTRPPRGPLVIDATGKASLRQGLTRAPRAPARGRPKGARGVRLGVAAVAATPLGVLPTPPRPAQRSSLSTQAAVSSGSSGR